MFVHQSLNSFFIYQCTDYRLNVDAFISEVLYVYYVDVYKRQLDDIK